MPYKALTYVVLGEDKYSPGDEISDGEFEAAGQTEDNIAQLIEGGAISADMDAAVHPDHQAVPESEEVRAEGDIRSGDGGSGNA